jgi:hypothetical protein
MTVATRDHVAASGFAPELNGYATPLDEVYIALGRYVIFPSEHARVAVTLWTAASHGIPAWDHATRLSIISPEKRCGKSRLLDVLIALSRLPLVTVNVSPAALVRSMDAAPTLMIDEADSIFGKRAKEHEDLRGILDAGFQRNRPYTRWDMQSRSKEECATFGMAALASIGELPDTIMDRSVVVRMRRRANGEFVAPYRHRRDDPPLEALGRRLRAWVEERLTALMAAEPEMPVEDRAADVWEPLVAIADVAGGDWPERARAACVALSEESETEPAISKQLLADIRQIFARGTEQALHTDTLIMRLTTNSATWRSFSRNGITSRQVYRYLRPYGIEAKTVRENGVPNWGFRAEYFHDAWRRYLEPEEVEVA